MPKIGIQQLYGKCLRQLLVGCAQWLVTNIRSQQIVAFPFLENVMFHHVDWSEWSHVIYRCVNIYVYTCIQICLYLFISAMFAIPMSRTVNFQEHTGESFFFAFSRINIAGGHCPRLASKVKPFPGSIEVLESLSWCFAMINHGYWSIAAGINQQVCMLLLVDRVTSQVASHEGRVASFPSSGQAHRV